MLESSHSGENSASTSANTAGLRIASAVEATHRPRIIVAIPTLNESIYIGAVVEQLVQELLDLADAVVVIADGGSTDGTREIAANLVARYPIVHYIDNPKRIQSAGINRAVRYFGRNADVLIRCDAHTAYPVNYCARLLDSLERCGADAVVVVMDAVGATRLQRAVARVSNSIVGTGGSAHRSGHQSGLVDHGHHAAFRMDTFRRIGGYDETFSHNEDAEFDCRQRAFGAKLYLDADIRVQYCPRSTWRSLALQYYRYGAGRSRTLRRHPSSIRARQLLVPVHFLLCALSVGLSPWWPGLLLYPSLYFLTLGASSVVLAVRHCSFSGLLAGPVACVMHFSWAVGHISGWLVAREPAWKPRSAIPLWVVTQGGEE